MEIPDFFRVEPAFTVCTPKVLNVLKKNRINCFELRLIDKAFCEKMFQIEKECNLKRDSGSVFFEKVRDSFVSAEQQGKK